MKKKSIYGFFTLVCMMAIGFVLSKLGVYYDTWGFWILILLIVVFGLLNDAKGQLK